MDGPLVSPLSIGDAFSFHKKTCPSAHDLFHRRTAHLHLVSVQNTDHSMFTPLLLPTLALIGDWKLLRAASQHPIHLCFLRA